MPKNPKTPAKKNAPAKKPAAKTTVKPAVKKPAKAALKITPEERGEVPSKPVKKAAKADLSAAAGKAKAGKKAAEKLGQYFYANGKRKTSVASIRLYLNGTGVITINNRSFENYFPVETDRDKILTPFRTTNTLKTFNVTAHVRGGGIHSQAEAVRHGVSKALLQHNAEFRGTLKPLGLLTRDSRIKERKKYGLKRARRAPQWQKR